MSEVDRGVTRYAVHTFPTLAQHLGRGMQGDEPNDDQADAAAKFSVSVFR